MPFEDILVAVEEPLGFITLNRPNVLNALRTRLLDELSAALRDMERDEKVRVVVITGAGEKAFAAGADISDSTPWLRPAREPRRPAAARPSRVRSSASVNRS